MKNYFDLIDQTFYFPTPEFKTVNNELYFNNIPLMGVIKEFGTPLKLTYLPKISQQIQYAKKLFNNAINKFSYDGTYTYCYCTKSSHFRFVLEEALKNDIQLETSFGYDLDIILKLYEQGLVNKNLTVVCNGFKLDSYKQRIANMINDGFHCIPILDNLHEIDFFDQHVKAPYKLGIRVACDEEPNFDFYTSRLGIRYSEIINFYKERIHGREGIELKILHFFVNSGIRDTSYYWSELNNFIYKYCELKKICPTLDTIDIGGGFPFKNSLHYDYDHQYMAEQIVENINRVCKKNGVPTPDLYTEFGSHTVGESGALLYSVVEQKRQNDKELWYMVDGSIITHLPDAWAKSQKYILLPVNNWDNEYHQVHIGGITCDSDDYYNSESHSANIFMPKIEENPLYIGFFHTGAYQESLGGYGGIQHCLIPSARHVIISLDSHGEPVYKLFKDEQESVSMLGHLGF